MDFGRIFPGLVLFLVGIVLVVALVFIAAVAYLFSFVAGSGEVMTVALQLALVPALLIAAGVVTMFTGVSWWGWSGHGWWSGIAKARAIHDRLRISERIGEIIGVAFTAIIFLFLYGNQLRGVGFFTPAFGTQASVYFYAPLFTGVALSIVRAVYGYKNAIRPFDAINTLFLAFAAFWLLSVFPFDFTHFGDMFPTTIQFLFAWLTNDVGRFVFTVAGIGLSAGFVYTTVLYLSVRQQLHLT